MNPAQDRPGSLFVCENTVEHTSWGPPVAAQNLCRINKEKRFPPDDFEKRLHGVVSLTGTNFQKQGRDVFFFCSITYTGLLEGRVILLRIAS